MPEIHMLKLLAIFLAIVVVLALKRPLYQAILAGLLATALLYQISPLRCLQLTVRVFTSWSSMSILVVLYLITFLQRMMEQRQLLRLAQQDLNGLFHNRRINASIVPLFIGLLPSAAAMILCGDIVKEATGGYLDRKEQAFVTNWFRHIPESSLPTYAAVLLMSQLSGVPIPPFMLGMVVPVIVLALLGYLPYLRRLPRDPGTPPSEHRGKDALHLLQHVWTLAAILVLILALGVPVVWSVGIVIVAALFVYRFRWPEIKSMLRSAVEPKMLGNTFLVLVFKEFVSFTGILKALPDFFSGLPVPMYLVFALLFFVGGVVSGSNGIIAMGTPIAFAAIPGAGVPLMVLLMCMCHAASQVSPVHVCLVVATEYFGVSLGDLAKKTLPISLLFCVLMIGYYHLLLLIV